MPVVVGRHHQALKVLQELLCIEGDRAADVDKVVVGLFQTLLGHKLLLVELLARAQPCVLYLDVHIGLVAREADKVLCKICDLDGASHIKDEYLAALGVGACQHYKAHGLGYGHEVADNVRVCDCYGAAVLDLLFEYRDNGAVAAKHVAEPYRHELCLYVLEDVAAAVLVGVLKPLVGEELRYLGGLSVLDLAVKALDYHFAEPL